MDVRVGLLRKLSTEELMLLNCGFGEDSWESLGLQGERSSQSILKEIRPEYSLEGLMQLKLQYFGHLMRRTDSLEKTLMLGKIEGRRKRGRQKMRLLDSLTDSRYMSVNNLREFVMNREGCLACCSPWGLKEPDTTGRLNWTECSDPQPFGQQGLISWRTVFPQIWLERRG